MFRKNGKSKMKGPALSTFTWEEVRPKIIASQLAINFGSSPPPLIFINQHMRDVAERNLKRIKAYQDAQQTSVINEAGSFSPEQFENLKTKEGEDGGEPQKSA